ncbi:MAG: sensor histidine kinase [Cyanobacteria bacterium J06641_5]
MSLRPPFQSSPLRLFAALEWVLLIIVAIAQVLLALRSAMPAAILTNGLGLGFFIGLGFISPRKQRAKVIYIILEFGLVLGLGFIGNIPVPVMLFVVLTIRNCVRLESRGRAIATGLAFFGCVILQSHRLVQQTLLVQVQAPRTGAIWSALILVSGLVIIFSYLLVDALLKEHQGQKQLAITNARLRRYALRIEELATVQERNRIAREIHDSLGHSLMAISINLEAALRLLQSHPEKAESLLLEMKQLNAKILQEVRESVTALRSDPLQGQSLAAAIADLMAEFQRSTGIQIASTIQLEQPPPRDLSLATYRIVQESLTNICKYAAATAVRIAIVRSSEHLLIAIEDNGKGFELSQNMTGFGLQGMQERALALDGKLEIVTAPGQGCCIEVILPI